LISQEKAAGIAGMSRWGFLDALAREQKDVFMVDIDSVKRELEGTASQSKFIICEERHRLLSLHNRGKWATCR
jgi:hypothetical protein